MEPNQDNQWLLALIYAPSSSPPSGDRSDAGQSAGQVQRLSVAATLSSEASRLINRSSREDPVASLPSTHFGFLPRPAQVSAGLSGLWYFGLTPRRRSSCAATRLL